MADAIPIDASGLAQARKARLRAAIRAGVPALSFLIILAAIWQVNPRAVSYFGLTLMLSLAVPVAFATLAQAFIMAGEDLDLSIGAFVSFVGCVAATTLRDAPLLGWLMLAGGVGVYALIGAIIHLRGLPAIVVTLGMSFAWQGLALLTLPKPGGKAPDWLLSLMRYKPPVIPFPLLAAAVMAALAWFVLMRTSYGTVLRGTGGNPIAVRRAGWSLLRAKMALYAMAGACGVLAGLSAVGFTTSADANFGNGYTLMTIAGVILGGGEFTGGKASPVGAVIGALTLSLAGALLNFLRIPPDWQVATQGLILIVALGVRLVANRLEPRP